MRYIMTVVATLVAVFIVHKTWTKPSAHIFTRYPPGDVPGWEPKMRTYKHYGKEVSNGWP